MRERTVIIGATERELLPLLRDRSLDLRPTHAIHAVYHTFENQQVVIVCAGMGGRPAADAAERAIGRLAPSMILSAGLAGALRQALHVGAVIRPSRIVQAGVEYRNILDNTSHILVSAAGIASAQAKRLLARQYAADIVDMDAAPVAAVAHRHGIPFGAVKAISDTPDFELPDLEPFIAPDGRFRSRAFAIHVAFRPRLWNIARELRANSAIAIQELCRELRILIQTPVAKVVK